MKNPVVRIIVEKVVPDRIQLGLRRTSDVELLITQLENAGILTVPKRETESGNMVIDLYPPQKVNKFGWAEMNAERMRSFGINAVVAPAWPV